MFSAQLHFYSNKQHDTHIKLTILVIKFINPFFSLFFFTVGRRRLSVLKRKKHENLHTQLFQSNETETNSEPQKQQQQQRCHNSHHLTNNFINLLNFLFVYLLLSTLCNLTGKPH